MIPVRGLLQFSSASEYHRTVCHEQGCGGATWVRLLFPPRWHAESTERASESDCIQRLRSPSSCGHCPGSGHGKQRHLGMLWMFLAWTKT